MSVPVGIEYLYPGDTLFGREFEEFISVYRPYARDATDYRGGFIGRLKEDVPLGGKPRNPDGFGSCDAYLMLDSRIGVRVGVGRANYEKLREVADLAG